MNSNKPSVEHRAEDLAIQIFRAGGWRVKQGPKADQYRPDFLVNKGPVAYVVELKAISEGRGDRVIPLLSQAILQARASARNIANARPLAIVCVGHASASLLKQVSEFAKRFASDAAVGVISVNGARFFLGDGLEQLNADASIVAKSSEKSADPVSNIFSDLNQWMLKVLLAPRIPDHLLNAPRGEYRNVSELANAANVSVMSAFRFAHQLRKEGFLDESSPHLKLVRREELFRRWQSVAFRPSPEIKMRFVIRRAAPAQLRSVLSGRRACLGLFAAAEMLRLGHVQGVPPYVYLQKLPRSDDDRWKELVPASPGEHFDLVLKQAQAPQSVFRGAVDVDGMAVSDVLQVWLDVSAHPSRGSEQGDLIRRKVLKEVFDG